MTPAAVPKFPECDRTRRTPTVQRRNQMFDSIFVAVREALTGLFTQTILELISGLFAGLLG